MQISRVKPRNRREGAGRLGGRKGGREGTRAKPGNQLVWNNIVVRYNLHYCLSIHVFKKQIFRIISDIRSFSHYRAKFFFMVSGFVADS